MSNSIGWGVIGCGDVVTRKTGPCLQEIAGSRIVAAMRRSQAAAEIVARRLYVPVWTTDAAEVIGHPRVNAIYVATPPASHLEYALAACEARKPCLVEKPAGRSDEECRQMVEAFRAANVPLFVSYYRRYLPRFLKVKEILDSGALGTILSIDFRLHKPPRKGDWRQTPRVSGGGQFYDLACHMLDVFDFWFGPIELTGSTVTNAIPLHHAEDAVALSFRTQEGAVGNALWNFASTHAVDELVIEGLGGRLSMEGLSRSAPVHLELSSSWAIRTSPSQSARTRRQIREALKIPFRKTYRFRKETHAHRPMLKSLVQRLVAGAGGDGSAEAGLRTSEVMNRALDDYYDGRSGAFWDRPERWCGLRTNVARLAAQDHPEYVLSNDQLRTFEKRGCIGPFKCDGDWQRMVIAIRKGRSLHLREPGVLEVCAHPSIVHRAAQLIGSRNVALFKSRFVVKMPKTTEEVFWHQDVGYRNGGYLPDGRPVPSVTVWLGLDRISRNNGGLEIIPGSHRSLIGDWKNGISSELMESGTLKEEELKRAESVQLEPGEFIIFHSWLLHASAPNRSAERRAGLNMRYVAQGNECEPHFDYIPLECPCQPRTKLLAVEPAT
ncbi:MAG: phytanoyl-CoA dioxygenase family protein [Pseudomonadales bacterium]